MFHWSNLPFTQLEAHAVNKIITMSLSIFGFLVSVDEGEYPLKLQAHS